MSNALPSPNAAPDFLPDPPPSFRPIISAPLHRPITIVSRDDEGADHENAAIWRADVEAWVLAFDRDAHCYEPHGWREIASETAA